MAIKKKVKISNVKRSQHVKQKKNYTKPLKKDNSTLKKTPTSGSISTNKVFGKPVTKSKTPKKPKLQKQTHLPSKAKEQDEESDEFNADDMLEMLDDEYVIDIAESKKRKRSEDADIEDVGQFERQYAADVQTENLTKKRLVNLLPIKTKAGEVITRQSEVDDVEVDEITDPESENEDSDNLELDSDDDIVHNDEAQNSGVTSEMSISTADLLILREQEIAKQKYRIGVICSGILEKPEDKVNNFSSLFDLMDDRCGERVNLITVRKIATISLLEVFKDVLPEYRIGQLNLKMTTVRKNTMERITFENALLQQYKKYLQKLEKMSSLLTRQNNLEFLKLGECAVQCMCEILMAHPYFNFSQNICQLLVYLINSNIPSVRQRILSCFKDIFKTDKKFDITLYIVRRLNHLIKSKSNCVHVEILTCLLSLQIKSINLDAEKEFELKQKKLEAQKSRLMNMSKKEKKRHKKLSQLDKELQETKAEENKQTKHYKLTEITKTVFIIYFRILKNDPNSQLLSATLEGLAQFSHVINLDFFADLVEVLNNIMETVELGHREQLHCIHTIFTILSGQGEVLNIDPLRFYGHLYRNLLIINAGQNHSDLQIILRTLFTVLIRRRKHISHGRLLAFVKRVATLSTQLNHHGSIACLGIIKTIMQLSSTLEILLDTDASVGSGRYNATLDDPEYCNAQCTALFEMSLLIRHYHPIVRKMATHIVCGVPASGDGSLMPEISKLTYEELYANYDSSEMVFNPPIPPPSSSKNLDKDIKGRHLWNSRHVETQCERALHARLCSTSGTILDFASEFKNGLLVNK